MRPGQKPSALFVRWFDKVAMSDEACWEWTASKTRAGYGKISLGGHAGPLELAHRLAYRFYVGDIPAGMLVCHHCDNPGCVRPSHLFLGTSSDNTQDMLGKGRENPPRGERNANAKLTADDVREIRRRLASGDETQAEIARSYGISAPPISLINSRKQWAWLR